MNNAILLELHPQYRHGMRNMAKVLLVLALIQLTAWLLPSLPEFKGIPNYLPLHTLLETVSIVVSMMVFAAGWNSHSRDLSGNIVLLACVSFSVGLLDFSHTVAYGGMPDYFSPNDAQKHLNFWLSARAFECAVLLLVAIRPSQQRFSIATRNLIFASLVAVTLAINWIVILHQAWLPDTFIPGVGLTTFKKDVEYIIIVVNAVTAAILWRKMREPQQLNVVLLFGAACTLAMSEFYFTLYTTMTGSYNVLGHVYKVLAYFFIYRAIVAEVVEEPYKQLAIVAQEQKAIVNSAIVGIVKLKDRRFIWANSAFSEMLGYGPEELLGKPTRMVYPSEDAYIAFAEAAYPAMQAGRIFRTETQYTTKNGSLRWYKVSGGLIGPGSAESIWAFIDITDHKELEQSLAESESRFRTMANNAPVLIWLSDTNKLCYWFNKVWLDFTGRSLEQESGNGWAEGVHPDDFDRCLDIYVRNFDQRKPFRMEYRLRHHSGEYRWIDDQGVPRFSEDGTFEGYIGSCTDIHDSKKLNAERDRLLQIIEDAPDFIATSDMQTHLKYLNPAGARLVGLPEDVDLSNLRIRDMHPEWATRRVLEEGVPAVLEHGIWNGETALLHRDGHETPVSQVLMVHRDQNGNPELLSTIMRDITLRKQAEAGLRDKELLLSESQRIGHIGSWHYELSGKLTWSDETYRIYGVSPDTFSPSVESLMGLIHPDDRKAMQEWIAACADGRKPGALDFRIVAPDGNLHILKGFGDLQFDARTNAPKNLIGIVQDVTERKQMEEQVRQLAFYDPLTNLPNRRLLIERLGQAVLASKRGNYYCALLFLDLDNFKPLNDAHGHSVGDLLLIEVASRITRCVRATDTTARFGGDEFVVVLNELGSGRTEAISQAGNIAEKIRAALSQPYMLSVKEDGMTDRVVKHHCTSSIGGTLFAGQRVSADDILKRADIAMYQAKEAGGDSVRFSDASIL